MALGDGALAVLRFVRLAAAIVLAVSGAVTLGSSGTPAQAQEPARFCGASPCGPQSYRALCGTDPSFAPGEVRYSTCLSDHRSCFVSGRWYCIPPSPEELAAKAARDRRAADRARLIDEGVSRLGAHRRAEVERSVDLRLNAEDARPKPRQPGPTPPKTCTTRSFANPISSTGRTREAALSSVNRTVAQKGGCNIGGSESVVSMTASAPACSQRPLPYMKPPPVGKCLACISEKQAALLGWVPGKGYPPPPTEWVCTATAQCTAQRCSTDSKVSAQ